MALVAGNPTDGGLRQEALDRDRYGDAPSREIVGLREPVDKFFGPMFS